MIELDENQFFYVSNSLNLIHNLCYGCKIIKQMIENQMDQIGKDDILMHEAYIRDIIDIIDSAAGNAQVLIEDLYEDYKREKQTGVEKK